MLQKTLLNIEGLGRQLDPDLDLWKTAKPFLERWMNEQVGWRGALKAIQHEAPQWAKTLPQLPRLVHQALIRTPDAEAIDARLARIESEQARQNRWFMVIAAFLGIIAVALLALVWLSQTA